ncbi:hypothetical protein KQ51_00667 [Candidatus Izimaplasma bacterium HR1]|uniref:DUF975 family protein n=1 Tax=Candidatus Izimoplasma sp. HR1 TaxID=1541959 RepID=UPI0004F725B9|nr:hypothetical protein KQ51_00667 [Candidatus Izimaplasma bacterium HR1]
MISNFKKQAKESLKGNWGNAIVVFLGIYFLGSFISSIPQYFVMPSYISMLSEFENLEVFNIEELLRIMGAFMSIIFALSMVTSIFVVAILQLGQNRFSIKLARTGVADVDCMFDGFKKNYFLNVKSLFMVGIYSFLWMIPFIVFTFGWMYTFSKGSEIYILFIILSFAAQIFAYIKILGYSVLNYLLMDDEVEFNTSTEYINESKRLMKGSKWQLVLLGLSFILWIFVVVITFGFAMIYLGPYMSQSITNFYNHIREEKNIAYE